MTVREQKSQPRQPPQQPVAHGRHSTTAHHDSQRLRPLHHSSPIIRPPVPLPERQSAKRLTRLPVDQEHYHDTQASTVTQWLKNFPSHRATPASNSQGSGIQRYPVSEPSPVTSSSGDTPASSGPPTTATGPPLVEPRQHPCVGDDPELHQYLPWEECHATLSLHGYQRLQLSPAPQVSGRRLHRSTQAPLPQECLSTLSLYSHPIASPAQHCIQ